MRCELLFELGMCLIFRGFVEVCVCDCCKVVDDVVKVGGNWV